MGLDREINDLEWVKPDSYNLLERTFLPYMKDERDLIFIRTTALITCTVLPLATSLFFLEGWLVWTLALPYIGFVFLNFGGRYGLMLHATGHRPMFKREYKWMQLYIPWVLGPFHGHTPTSFDAHHMWMHHAENNMLADHSTTLPYKRDSFTHFLHYFARFILMGHAHLIRYLALRGRHKIIRKLLIGELTWLAIAVVACQINFAAGMVVFVIPMLMMRWLMMAGNFAQHAFVNVDDPDSGYTNSNNLINAKYNLKAYNDGYHIVHHERPAMHWSEMPGHFLKHYDTYVKHDAVIFDGLADNQAVWFLLMTKNYDKLARHLVDLTGERTHEEKIAFLQGRVQTQKGRIRGIFELEDMDDVLSTKRSTTLTVEQALAAD